MKKYRKWMAELLCAAMLCGMPVQAAAAETGERLSAEAVLEDSLTASGGESAGMENQELSPAASTDPAGNEVSGDASGVVSAEEEGQTAESGSPETTGVSVEAEETAPEEGKETPTGEQAEDIAIRSGTTEDSVPQSGQTDGTTSQEGQTSGADIQAQERSEDSGAAVTRGEADGVAADSGKNTSDAAKDRTEQGQADTSKDRTKQEESENNEEAADADEEEELTTAKEITVEYRTHVQTYGWEKEWAQAGDMSGTEGKAKRLEGIRIRLVGAGKDDYIEYCTHVQTYGWETEWARNGDMSGTEGQAKRLEGIRIRLSPSLEEDYDIYYCVHAQTYGWLGWAKNGEPAGTEGLAKRLEGIRIVIGAKNSQPPEPIGTNRNAFVGSLFKYQTHVQTYGWQNWVTDKQSSGTTGESKRLEGIRIEINESMRGGLTGSVEYRTHVQTYGWETAWSRDGEMSGTQGQSKRLEGIQIRLTGELAEKYDIYYRVHAQTYGWLDWAKNGEQAGTEGMAKRLEAIQITAVPKGGAAPGKTFAPFRKPMSSYTVPYAQPTSGTRTIRNLLRTALVPCGRTLYQWGGGHGPDANQAGMPQQWVNYFESHSAADFEPQYTYIQYWNGVDCSGYSGWVVANTTGDYSISTLLAQSVAQAYTANKWTVMYGTENQTFRPGDFVSVLYGHIWISLGQCSDGSTLLIHSAGNGIQLSGTGGKAMYLADYYMQKYFPYWPYSTNDYSWLLDEPSYTARWITNGSGLLTDPDGMQKMSAEQVMQILLGN